MGGTGQLGTASTQHEGSPRIPPAPPLPTFSKLSQSPSHSGPSLETWSTNLPTTRHLQRAPQDGEAGSIGFLRDLELGVEGCSWRH